MTGHGVQLPPGVLLLIAILVAGGLSGCQARTEIKTGAGWNPTTRPAAGPLPTCSLVVLGQTTAPPKTRAVLAKYVNQARNTALTNRSLVLADCGIAATRIWGLPRFCR